VEGIAPIIPLLRVMKMGHAKVISFSESVRCKLWHCMTSAIWWIVRSLTPDKWAMVRRFYGSDQGANFSIFKPGILSKSLTSEVSTAYPREIQVAPIIRS